MHINASKIKVVSVLIPDEQRQAVPSDCGPLEDVKDATHDTQGKLGTSLRTASLRLRTIEKGLGEGLL